MSTFAVTSNWHIEPLWQPWKRKQTRPIVRNFIIYVRSARILRGTKHRIGSGTGTFSFIRIGKLQFVEHFFPWLTPSLQRSQDHIDSSCAILRPNFCGYWSRLWQVPQLPTCFKPSLDFILCIWPLVLALLSCVFKVVQVSNVKVHDCYYEFGQKHDDLKLFIGSLFKRADTFACTHSQNYTFRNEIRTRMLASSSGVWRSSSGTIVGRNVQRS